MVEIVLLLACVAGEQETGSVGSKFLLEPEVSQVLDTPMRRVKWSTPEATVGEVRYGKTELDMVVIDDEVGTEHDVWVPGLGIGTDWELQVVAEVGGEPTYSEIFAVESVGGPANLPMPKPTVSATTELSGFSLVPVQWPGGGYVTVLNGSGTPIWWKDMVTSATFRARYHASGPTISYINGLPEEGPSELVSTTLDGIETRIPLVPGIHHDFLALPDGSFVTIRYVEHVLDGGVMKSDLMEHVQPDGSVRKVWDTFDAFEWPGGGLEDGFGRFSWPHANSMYYDAKNEKILVSLYYLGTIAQIDLATGQLDWMLGGEFSDWTIVGESFSFQHGPALFDEGRGLTLLDNGDALLGDAGVARAYLLDEGTRTATATWKFDNNGAYTHLLLGGVDPVPGGAYAVNWGTRGVLQRVSAEGDVELELSSNMGSFFGFTEHLAEFAGASR